MESSSEEISCLSQNKRPSNDCLNQQLQSSKNAKTSLSSLQNLSSLRLESLDFYNDIVSYKNAVKEITKIRSIMNDGSRNFNNEENKEKRVEPASVEKYALVRPGVLAEKIPDRLPNGELKEIKTENSKKKLQKSVSENTLKALRHDCKNVSHPSNRSTSGRPSVLRRSNVSSVEKKDLSKVILVADPEIVEFHNCELLKTYKKTIRLKNVDTQLARFRIKGRPSKSAFTIFVESPWGTDKDNIAPGMNLRIIVHYRCVDSSEPTETLVLPVLNGKPVYVELRVKRDPPVLRALAQSTSSPPCAQFTDSKTTTTESRCFSSRSSAGKSQVASLISSESQSPSSDGLDTLSYARTFDCKKCFVGEFVIISTVLKNLGGKGRFFVMSEIDWCSMDIEDITGTNLLVASPFAVWPAYFILEPNEQLTLYTYYFPDSYGFQAVELYIVTDNCSLNTMEVIGDGIIFEPQSLKFDKKVEYQCFKTKRNDFCTIRYLELGVGTCNGLLASAFTITSSCDLDLYYRWEISDVLLCMAELKNTIERKSFNAEKLAIEPYSGVFYANSQTTFKVVADLRDVQPGNYRITLQLIVEDIPLAAVTKKHNFPWTDCKTNRRLCEHPVDLNFENIEVRMKCVEIFSEEDYGINNRLEEFIDDNMLTMSLADLTNMTGSAVFRSDQVDASDSSSSRSDDVCRRIQGYGTCDCCKSELISTAVLRPTGPLHVGIESQFTISLYNKSSKRLKYWWSDVVGADHTKIKVKIEPKFDHIMPDSCQPVKLRLLPLETGDVSSIFVPCQFNGTSPVVLSIECTIEALKVSFYFPSAVEEHRLARIEWFARDYVSKLDKKVRSNEKPCSADLTHSSNLCSQTCKIRLIKRKVDNETFLHTMVLNSHESLAKTSCYSESYENQEQIETEDTLTQASTLKTGSRRDNSFDSSSDFWEPREAGEESDGSDRLKLLPYFDLKADLIRKLFRYLPLVIEFHVTPEKSQTKRFYIVNEGPIASKYVIKTRNASKEDTLKDYSVSEEELESGVVVTIEPSTGEIRPYETVEIDVTAKSNTWGIYTDEVTVRIDMLTDYKFWVRIINDKLPISYPVCRNSSSKVPKLRFKIFKPGCSSEKRRILIENTSIIPLYVHWHCFSMSDEEDEAKPFQLLFDMLTPFISVEEFFAANSELLDAIRKYFSCAYNTYESKDYLDEIDEYNNKNCRFDESSDSSSKLRHATVTIAGGAHTRSSEKSASETFDSTTATSTLTAPLKNTTKKKDTEFQLTIVPYCGKIIHDVFLISPQELFLPPKEKRYLDISVNSEKLDDNFEKILCKVFGFIRIPPIFKYKDNVFFRKDGYYLPPTEILLECDLKKPYLEVKSSRREHIFEFHVKEFNTKNVNEIRVEKKLSFKNTDTETLYVQFEVSKPFNVKRVATQREIFFCGKNARVHPGDTIKVDLECLLDVNDIDWLKRAENRKTYSNDTIDENKKDNTITTNKCLQIKFKEGFLQTVAVHMRICFPSLKISSYHLNFGALRVGSTQSISFEVQNLLDRTHDYEIEKEGNVEAFTIFPRKAFLTSKGTPETSRMEITARFIPIDSGVFRDTLKVISKVEGLVARCVIEGFAYSR